MIGSGHGINGSIRANAGGSEITDATIISRITDSSNWDADGNYTGSTAGLNDLNYYIDEDWAQKYVYYATPDLLTRTSFNTLID